MEKVNHLKKLSEFYKQRKNMISLLKVPSMQFLTIDGEKSPNDNPDYSDAVGALYAVAYKLKFMIKKGPMEIDYKVMPLEGLWWTDIMEQFSLENRENWKWRMMIMQPEFITMDMFAEALKTTKRKKDNPKLDFVQFISFDEGLSMQIFHKGPYGEGERESINKLHAAITDQGYQRRDKHHEIYFNSPLRTAPENLKTIIRQPIKK